MHNMIKLFLAFCSILAIAACSGGGDGTTTATTTPGGITGGTTSTAGIAVDPYIVGAVFVEVDTNGQVIQTSTPSDSNGHFLFAKKVMIGNTITMQVPGLHASLPFKGKLKRRIKTDGSEFVISPLTTLLANQTEIEVLQILTDAGFVGVTEADLTRNPLADLTTDASHAMLLTKANLAVNTALNAIKDDFTPLALVTLGDVVTKVHDILEKDTDGNGVSDLDEAQANHSATNMQLIQAAAAIVDFVIHEVETTVQAGNVINSTTLGDTLDPAIIESAVQQAADGQAVLINLDASGTPAVSNPPGTIAEFLAAAQTAWESADVINSNGKKKYGTDKLLEAVDNFMAAKALIGIDTAASPQDIDRARFFGSLAAFAKLADPYSDMTSNGLNNLGDILDAFGVDTTPRDNTGNIHIENCVDVVIWTDPQTGISYTQQQCELIPFAADSPDMATLLDSLRTNMKSHLEDVAAGMTAVSPQFIYSLKMPGSLSGTEFDYGDALFFKALARAMIAQLDILNAYKAPLDIDNEQAISTGTDTSEAFLGRNQTLGELSSNGQALLSDAKIQLGLATDAALGAILAIEAEIGSDYSVPVDPQDDDFISLNQDTCVWSTSTYTQTCTYDPILTAKAIDDMKLSINKVKNGLNNPTTFNKGTADPSDDVTANLHLFFEGMNLRELIPTNYSAGAANDMLGTFPDPTMGGVIDPSQFNINEDLDGDGSPDWVDGYSYFMQSYLQGKTYQASMNDSNNQWIDFSLTFDQQDSAVTFQQLQWTSDPITGQSTKSPFGNPITGAYALSQANMYITWDQLLPNNSKFTSADLTSYYGKDNLCSLMLLIEYQDINQTPLTTSYAWWQDSVCY